MDMHEDTVLLSISAVDIEHYQHCEDEVFMVVKSVEEVVIDDHTIIFNIIRVYVEKEECDDDEKSPCKRHHSFKRLNSKILKGY